MAKAPKIPKAYKPSGKIPFIGLVLMIVFGLIAAVVLSYIYSLIVSLLPCYPAVIFPAILGGLVGGAVLLGVRWGKVRNPFIAGAIAILFGLLAIFLVQVWNYIDFIGFVEEELALEAGDPLAMDIADLFLEEETGHPGVIGWVMFESTLEGDAIIEIEPGGGLTELDPFGYYLFLVLDVLTVAGMSGVFAWFVSSEPFCETDRAWSKTAKILSTSVDSAAAIAEAIHMGRYDELPGLVLEPEGKDRATCKVELEYCPQCHEGFVDISASKGTKSVRLYNAAISGNDSQMLLAVAEQIKGQT